MKRFIIGTVVFVLLAGLFVTEVEAGKNYLGAVKRRTKKYFYKIQPKPIPTVKLDVPFHRQEHSLSCEAAALQMALAAKGVNISESTLIDQISVEPMWGNPHTGFVGDINGKMLKTGYGVYWEPITRVGSRYRESAAFEHGSPSSLALEIANGNPIVFWGYVGSGRGRKWITPDGTPIIGIAGEHARVLIGFRGSVDNPAGFYLLDPIYGELYWNTGKLQSNGAPFGDSGVIIR